MKGIICLLLILPVIASASVYELYTENNIEALSELYYGAVNDNKLPSDSVLYYYSELTTDIAKSVTLYRQIVNKYNDSPFYDNARYRLAKYYQMIGDTSEMTDMIQKLIYSQSPFGDDALLMLIGYYEGRGANKQAEDYIMQLRDQYPESPYNEYFKSTGMSHTKDIEDYFTIQTGAYSSEDNASRQAAEFRAKGYDAFVVKIQDLYKVMIGRFNDRTKAERYSKVLQKAEGISVWVVKVD